MDIVRHAVITAYFVISGQHSAIIQNSYGRDVYKIIISYRD